MLKRSTKAASADEKEEEEQDLGTVISNIACEEQD